MRAMRRWGGRRRGFGRSSRAGRNALALLIVMLAALTVLLFLYNAFWSTDRYRIRTAVESFYAYEKIGDYASAWELLHSGMKEQIGKEAYVQSRAALYMQLTGGGGFQIAMGEPERLSSWQMSESAQPLTGVYRIPVKQRFVSIFGALTIEQDVFAAEENGEWRLLWSYREPAD